MKIRSGLVSNSSSSSFIIVTTAEAHKKAIKNLHPYYKTWINEYLNLEEVNFLNNPVLYAYDTLYSDDMQPMAWNKEFPPEAEDTWCDNDTATKWVEHTQIIQIYMNALKKVSDDVICEWN